MKTGQDTSSEIFHAEMAAPSPWVVRFAGQTPPSGGILDVACGSGRHSRLFAGLGHPVTAVDRDISRLGGLADHGNTTVVEADLEGDGAFPIETGGFAAVVVTNYLWRPLFGDLVQALAPGGLLIYETFAQGNERFGRPRNPDHLLRPGELLEVAREHGLVVLAYEHGEISDPKPAVVQRMCARK
jgi:SAM-dependent methyltransferase